MRRLAESGASVNQIAAWSGHQTWREVAHYTRSAEQALLAQEALAKTRTKLSKPVGLTVKNAKKANENKGEKTGLRAAPAYDPVDFAPGSRFAHPKAPGEHPVHDTQVKRLRHLNFLPSRSPRAPPSVAGRQSGAHRARLGRQTRRLHLAANSPASPCCSRRWC
jgi:hypothetical protein